MKYYFRLLQILLVLSGMENISASCCCWKSIEPEDDTKRITPLALREISCSTDSTGSDVTFSMQPSSPRKERLTSEVFDVYGGNFSPQVIEIQEDVLRRTYHFNNESARCFMNLKLLMNDFSYEGLLEKTKDVRRHALEYLNEREGFFPDDYPEEARQNLVYALQVLMQKRYALLNYCMKILLDQPTTTSEFFLYFSDKNSITQKFSESLATFVASNPATKMSPLLKEKLSKADTWITIVCAFGTYPTTRSCWKEFFQKLDYFF